jgi:hypothetical protein
VGQEGWAGVEGPVFRAISRVTLHSREVGVCGQGGKGRGCDLNAPLECPVTINITSRDTTGPSRLYPFFVHTQTLL